MDRLDVLRGSLVAFVAVAGIALVVAASSSTAAFGVFNPGWDGASELRSNADAVGITSEVATETSAYEALSASGTQAPNETVAIVLSPATPYNRTARNRVRAFVQRGGTLVVADDFGNHSNALLRGVGAAARFDGALVRDDRFHYRDSALPVADNTSAHPFLDDVDALTLNHGTVVRPRGARVLVRTSPYSYLDLNRNGDPDIDESLQRYPVLSIEQVGAGRVVTLSDSSVFINAMLDRTDNRAFLRAVLGAHDHVLLDYSHAAALPPLSAAILTLRQSVALQFVVGVGGVLVILLVGWRNVLASLRKRWESPSGPADIDRREMVARIETRYRDGSDHETPTAPQRLKRRRRNIEERNDGSG